MGMRYSFTIVFIWLACNLNAQDMLVRKADDNFKDQQYNKAIEFYKKAYDKNPKSYYVVKRLALSYQRIQNTIEAEKWMKVLFENGRTIASDLLMFSEILTENGRYDEARRYLDEYIALKPDDKNVAKNLGKLAFIKTTINDSSAFSVGKVSFNTPGAELGACFYKDGVVFSSTSLSGTKEDKKLAEDELPFLDMYFAKEIAPGKFSDVVPFAPDLKTRFNDGPVAYDPVEDLFYITQYAPKAANTEEGSNVFHLQIIIAEERDGEWVLKEKFIYDNPNYSVAHPSVSPGGKLLYFVSDMPGGYGGYDIYFCYKKGKSWSEPYNLGPVTNSKGNEFFPFIDSRGDLYFTSSGHTGLGAQDIYMATSEDGVFNRIRNLGYPVNSPKDDVAFVLDSNSGRGYFSSNRIGGLGYYDIYSVQVNFIPVVLRGVVKDFGSKAGLPGATIRISDSGGKVMEETQTNTDGSFSIPTKREPSVVVLVEKEGYEPINKTLETSFLKAGEELGLEIFLRKKQNGK